MEQKYNKVDISLIKERLRIDISTGILYWKVSLGGVKIGDIAGYKWKPRTSKTHYYQISINNVLIQAHRIAYIFYYGAWPSGDIDHINGNGTDNRKCNIRDTSKSENLKNKSLYKCNSSGFNGVNYRPDTGKWRSRIRVDGKLILLGQYTTLYAACYARHAANIKYGFHKNHGRSF